MFTGPPESWPRKVERKDPAYYERRLHILLVQRFLRHVHPRDAMIALIANGEYRPPQTLDLLVRMGLLKGLTDLQLILPRGRTRWIEVKLESTIEHGKTGLTDEQIEMHDQLRELDHQADVVRSFDEFWAIVEAESIPNTYVRRNAMPQEMLPFQRRRRATHTQ